MANLCNIDGVLVAEADARIPVLDRGFLFGDSIYEVLRTEGEVPFAWPEHHARLLASAASLRLRLDLTEAQLAKRVAATMAAAGNGDSYVRIIATRGTGAAPNIALEQATGSPRWVILVRPLARATGKPTRLAIVDRLRNDRRALDPATKSGNYLNNVLGLAEAHDAGATDCLMANANGHVAEASTANVFALFGRTWCTPPLAAGILAGITRNLLLDHLTRSGERVEERDIATAEIRRADELFLCSTLRDISPVTHLDGNERNGGAAGPATSRLMASFAAYCDQLCAERYAPHWRRLLGSA